MASGPPPFLRGANRKCPDCCLQVYIYIVTLLHSNKPPVVELLSAAEERSILNMDILHKVCHFFAFSCCIKEDTFYCESHQSFCSIMKPINNRSNHLRDQSEKINSMKTDSP